MHPEDIKAAIRRRGTTVTALGERYGLDGSTIRAALRRLQPAGNRAIADYLDLPLNALWPQWFDEDGEIRPGARKSSRRPQTGHCQKRRVA